MTGSNLALKKVYYKPVLKSLMPKLAIISTRFLTSEFSSADNFLNVLNNTFVLSPSLERFKMPGPIFSLEKIGCCGSQNFGAAPTIFGMDLLEVDSKVHSLCWSCLGDLKFYYGFYNKLRSVNSNFKYLYQEGLSNVLQYVEDENLPEDDLSSLLIQNFLKVDSQYMLEEPACMGLFLKTNESSLLNTTESRVVSRDNIALMLTKFFPSTLKNRAKSDETEWLHSLLLLMVDYKVVKVMDLRNLKTFEYDEFNTKTDGIYKCQYCPQALSILTVLLSDADQVEILIATFRKEYERRQRPKPVYIIRWWISLHTICLFIACWFDVFNSFKINHDFSGDLNLCCK
uniref:Uncharacterized protein n=1 Tax=Glossina austeni TaxID=7395 RepID=A0A1A9UPQ8_GLOAU